MSPAVESLGSVRRLSSAMSRSSALISIWRWSSCRPSRRVSRCLEVSAVARAASFIAGAVEAACAAFAARSLALSCNLRSFARARSRRSRSRASLCFSFCSGVSLIATPQRNRRRKSAARARRVPDPPAPRCPHQLWPRFHHPAQARRRFGSGPVGSRTVRATG